MIVTLFDEEQLARALCVYALRSAFTPGAMRAQKICCYAARCRCCSMTRACRHAKRGDAPRRGSKATRERADGAAGAKARRRAARRKDMSDVDAAQA